MALSLQQKIQDPTQGVYLIGTTPPKMDTEKDKVTEIANKLLGAVVVVVAVATPQRTLHSTSHNTPHCTPHNTAPEQPHN